MSNAASDSTHGSLGGLELLIGEALVGREREGHVALATAHKHIAEQHAAQGGVVARAGGDCNVVRRAATGGRRQRLTPRLRGVGGAQWLKGVSVEGGRHGGARRRVAKNHRALRGALQDHAIAQRVREQRAGKWWRATADSYPRLRPRVLRRRLRGGGKSAKQHRPHNAAVYELQPASHGAAAAAWAAPKNTSSARGENSPTCMGTTRYSSS
jgi:hypothetical protein